MQFGVDIHDFFTGRRHWAQLERLIERLPRHSRYKAALEEDEKYAALALAMQKNGTEQAARVPLVGYDETVARLDNIFDAINALTETLITVYSKRSAAKPKAHRAPRPESGQQRVRRLMARQKIDSIVDRMTGGR